jgi:hypothetical protein
MKEKVRDVFVYSLFFNSFQVVVMFKWSSSGVEEPFEVHAPVGASFVFVTIFCGLLFDFVQDIEDRIILYF